jgi:sterol-4alpha-carboxylate 3-dehydrogenase (decarboxylating)
MDLENISGPVLVFGGCGFLGHHLVKRLLDGTINNHQVTVVDVVIDRNRHPSATYRVADITKRDEVAKVYQEVNPQVVFHMVSPNPFERDHSLLERVNVTGTQSLISCAKAISTVRAFMYTSSSSVVHNQRQPMVEATEDLPVLFYPYQPEFYSHTKALAESMVLTANRNSGMLTASIRPGALYGPRDNMMSTNVTNSVLRGRAKIRFGTGEYLYDTCSWITVLMLSYCLPTHFSKPVPHHRFRPVRKWKVKPSLLPTTSISLFGMSRGSSLS